MAFKILYVEDEAQNIALVREIFKLTDYELTDAHDGQSGYETTISFQPNLILMDINLPDIDGIELMGKIKQTPGISHIPVIALTADDSRENKERCEAAGFAAILFKPVSRFTLLGVIRKYVEPRGVVAAPQESTAAVEQPSRKKVLVVDDNDDLRMIFARVFDRLNFDVRAVSDGIQAIEHLGVAQPDVVILDVNMPGLSGIDVLSYIRGNKELRNTKVIIATGNSQIVDDPMIVRKADLVLLKPINIHELMYFAKRLIEESPVA